MLSTVRPWENPNEQIIPVVPNWDSAYRTSYEFKSDIITSENGKEQRRAVRDEPRQFIEFQSAMGGETKRDLTDFLAAWQPFPIAFADPIDVALSDGGMLAGSTLMLITNRPAWLLAGTEVILRDGRRMETRIVGNSDTNLVSFVDSSSEAWPVRTRICKVIRGTFDGSAAASHLTTNAMTVPIKIKVNIGGPRLSVLPPNPENIYNGRELWTKKHNWKNGVDVEHVWVRDEVDYGMGRTASFVPFEFANRIIKTNYIARDRDEVLDAISFFVDKRGQAKEFLWATGENDVPYAGIIGGTDFIQIAGQKFGRQYAGSTVFRRIQFRMYDGTRINRMIDEILYSADDNTSTISLTEDLPAIEFSPRTMVGISWTFATRFATDKLDIDWLTDDKAQFALTMKTLENDE